VDANQIFVVVANGTGKASKVSESVKLDARVEANT
jgi:hypothetical protein